MEKFKHKNREYELKIGYGQAVLTFPEKFDIQLTKLLGDMDATNTTLNKILLDDEVLIALMWYYVADQSDSLTYEAFLDGLETEQLTAFREAFWEETLNFSGPLKIQPLKDMMRMFRRELKNMKLDELDLKSHPEASTPTPTPSES